MKPHNFSAGPSILPEMVFKQAAAAIENFADTGLSILEVSHRGPQFVEVMHRAQTCVKELLGLTDDFDVMFLTGGASTQFFMTAMNLLGSDQIGYYINTGTWSKKAIKEARAFGNIVELASSEEANFNYIPKPNPIPGNGQFLHITSNNTIFGTQYHKWPETKMPIICDASSDIFSRPMPIDKFGCIYAGAQKNMGPAGTTLVILRKDMLGKTDRAIPTMLDYQTHIDKDSAFNTPPVFPIYVSLLVMEWIKEQGGLGMMQEKNEMKAKILYDAIDASSLFEGTAEQEDRSLMNVTFVCKDPDLTSRFLDVCTEEKISGLKGHRSVGGFRASIYNAMPQTSIQHLVDVMKEFERKS